MPRLLIMYPSRLDGENRGLYEQHVSSMKLLLDGAEGWEAHALESGHPSGPDAVLAAELVVIHMLGGPEVEAIIRLRRARGLATIFEISDNFLALGPWLPARHVLRNPLVRQRIVYHASIADAVQVYSPGLAALCRHVHDRVVQFDPYVPLRDRVPRRHAGVVVGWGGSTSHEEDLVRVAPVIEHLCRDRGDVTFAFMGNLAMGERVFGGIPGSQRDMRPFGDFARFLDFASTWDIGLAPLGRSGFNLCRTDTKLVTYAACGVVPVAEESDAYRSQADHVVMYRDAAELARCLDWLCDDRSRIALAASRAYDWAAHERSPERLRAQRISAYEPFVRRETGETMTIARDAPAVDAGNIDALPTFVATYPHHAYARLALADALTARGDDAGALALLDASPFPPVLAGLVAERQHALARRVCPERAAAYEARIESTISRVRIDHGGGDRQAFLSELLARQPFDFFALSNRLRDLLASGADNAELHDVCRRACLIAPELVPDGLRPPSLGKFLPVSAGR